VTSKAGAKCAECPFAVKGKAKNFVMPRVQVAARGVVVLEAPSKEDVDQQAPLEDRAGGEFKQVMLEAGLQLDAMQYVHATACSRKQPEADPEMRKALECCKPLFAASLAHLEKSTPVLAVGKWAAAQLTGKEKAIGSIRGFYGEEDIT